MFSNDYIKNLDLDDFQEKYFHKDFLTLYFIIFFFLYFFCSFVKFLGQLPVLIVVTFFVCVTLQNRYNLGIKKVTEKFTSKCKSKN